MPRLGTTDRRIIAALAAAVFTMTTVALTAPAGAARDHTHHRNHRRPHGSSAPAALTAGRTGKTTSQNWSGYVARNGTFTSISGSWTVPAVDCSSTPNGVAAMWVGLDGAGSHTVEQTGTFSICDGGVASYGAWFEAFPASSVRISNTVAAGDGMTATVTNTAPQAFDLVLTNKTRGWTSTNPITVRGRLASAEAVAEAPSLQQQIQPLANFGTVSFSNVTVNGAPIDNVAPQAITMAALGGRITKAVPGPLAGGSFSVSWRHA